MILDKVKLEVNSFVGKKCKFIYHGSRNQKEEFYGVIVKTFPSVFIIKTEDGISKSYSYSDILISTLEIIG